jgi:hypothetical protein
MKRIFWTIASLGAAIPAFILMLPGLAALEFANYCERKRRESKQKCVARKSLERRSQIDIRSQPKRFVAKCQR